LVTCCTVVRTNPPLSEPRPLCSLIYPSLIIKRQNFRLFFSSIHLLGLSPFNYWTMEGFFCPDLYISLAHRSCLEWYRVRFENVSFSYSQMWPIKNKLCKGRRTCARKRSLKQTHHIRKHVERIKKTTATFLDKRKQ
jgi:hypothetical protein